MEVRKVTAVLVIVSITFLVHPTTSAAAGFALIEQGTKGLGNAYAGASAVADDGATVYFNPAGMTRLSGTQVAGAGHLIIPSAKFSDDGSRIGTASLTGDNGGNAGVLAVVPNFYYVKDLSSDWKFGFGINVPFGLTSEYNDTWKGRYHAIRSELMTLNLNPSIAYKATPSLSLGFGVNAQYANVELTNAVDLRRLVSGTTAQDADAKSKVTGDDWGYGYNLGMLYELSSATRIGLAYRSQVALTLKGDAEFTPTNATAAALLSAVQATGSLVNTTVSSKTTLPETVSIAGFHQINSAWAIMADATWTRWSRFKELRIDFDSAQSDSVTPQDWKDSWRYGVGVNWNPGGAIIYRAGIAYDQTPVPNAERRSPRVPDNSRRWLAFGGTYQSSKSLSFDFGYAHLFQSNAAIDNTDTFGHELRGVYDNNVNILSSQVKWVF